MENYTELYHWGIKGQKWGVRRYQNKDGSLTPLGQKRYNQEVERLNKESEKVAAAEKVAANKRAVQAQKDALKAQKADLKRRKKALKGKGDDEAEKKAKEDESVEERREKLLKSTNVKELYENRHLLSTVELNERINRLDTEAKLQGKLPKKEEKTGLDYLRKAKDYVDATSNLYKSVDNAYSSVLNSSMGKTLAKKLGLDTPKETWIQERMRKYKEGKLNANEIMELNKYLNTDDTIKKREKDKADAKAAAKEAEQRTQREAEARRQVDEYNERWRSGDSDDRVNSSDDPNGPYSANGRTASGARDGSRDYRTSTRTLGIEQRPTRLSDDDVEVIPPDTDWSDRYHRYQESQSAQSNARNFTNNSGSTELATVNNRTSAAGEQFITIAGNVIPLLEDHSR